MRIVDSDTDEILGVDQTGELQVKEIIKQN